MGLANDRKNYKYVSLRTQQEIGGRKEVAPAFVLVVKNPDGTYSRDQEFNTISGQLTEIKKSSYDYEGQTIHKVSLTFFDRTDKTYYKLDMGYSAVMRNIMNSLGSCQNLDDISIRVFKGKNKETQKDYAGAVVYYHVNGNAVKCEWVIPYEEIKALYEKYTVRGQEQFDTFKADEMVIDRVTTIISPLIRNPEGDVYEGHPIVDDARFEGIEDDGLPAGETPAGETMLDEVRKDRAGRETKKDESFPVGESDDLPF